jgi:triosephosphate isomerase (TIM)
MVVVGHSERRLHFGETDADVARKAKAAADAGITPIVAVGETENQRADGHTETVIGGQVTTALRAVDAEQTAAIAIAYEPVWAIGTGRTADADTAAEAIGFLRGCVGDIHGADAAERVRILYGGSVNPGNIAAFMAKRDIDGALVGGASLDPDQFAAIIRYWI